MKKWNPVKSLRFFDQLAERWADVPLRRADWIASREREGHDQAEVDSIYAEVIAKIPAGATKVLEIGSGDGSFYRALKAARPALDYVGIDLVPQNVEDAASARGAVTVTGVQNGDTLTIGGVTLTASGSQGSGNLDFDESVTQATATITVAGVQAAEWVKIANVTLTASGSQGSGNLDFNEAAGSDDAVASSLAAAINDAGNGLGSFVTASATGAVVTLTAVPSGSEGNGCAPLRSSNDTQLALSGGDLLGGSGSDLEATASLVAAINDAGNGLAVRATNENGTSTTITLWADPGTAGNAITLSSSDGGRLAVSGANLEGGVAEGTFLIGNAWEFLSQATVDWDFVVSVNCLFSYTARRGQQPKTLLELLDAKAPKGFVVLGDRTILSSGFCTDLVAPLISNSTGVAESYHEGARDFLQDALVKHLFPIYVHRDGTPAKAPEKLEEVCCPITTGAFNRALGREVARKAAQKGRAIPTEFKGIDVSGGLVTGKSTKTIEDDWKKQIVVKGI